MFGGRENLIKPNKDIGMKYYYFILLLELLRMIHEQ